jgi:hypothetical protein
MDFIDIIAAVVFGGLAAAIIFFSYVLLTTRRRYEEHYDEIKNTEWIVERWSSPSDLFLRYWLVTPTILIPIVLLFEVFGFDLVYVILLLAIWSVCYVLFVNHFLVRPSLRGTSFKGRNRDIMPGEVTSIIGMVLDDMGVPYERYTFPEYETAGLDPRLIWELLWAHHCKYIYDLHPGQPTDKRYSIVIGEIGDVGIYFSQIRLTPYDDETASFFDELSEEIDKDLF